MSQAKSSWLGGQPQVFTNIVDEEGSEPATHWFSASRSLSVDLAIGEVKSFIFRSGEPSRTRTCDPLVKSQLLYQLSYRPGCNLVKRILHSGPKGGKQRHFAGPLERRKPDRKGRYRKAASRCQLGCQPETALPITSDFWLTADS